MTQIGNPGGKGFIVYGSWGTRRLFDTNLVGARNSIHAELIRDGFLPANSPPPSNRDHHELTETLARISWDHASGKWVAV